MNSHPSVLELKSARHPTHNSKPDIVVVVLGIVVVASSRATVPWIVIPGTTAFFCLSQFYSYQLSVTNYRDLIISYG